MCAVSGAVRLFIRLVLSDNVSKIKFYSDVYFGIYTQISFQYVGFYFVQSLHLKFLLENLIGLLNMQLV
jgi:hypothetical protein